MSKYQVPGFRLDTGDNRSDGTSLVLAAGTGVTFAHGYSGATETLTISASGGGGAPTTAEYLTKSADATLSAERVVTDTASLVWDWATGGQAKANVQFGTSSSVACVGNDARLSDARTPTAHQTTHRVGGIDALPTGDATTPGLLKLGASGGADAYGAAAAAQAASQPLDATLTAWAGAGAQGLAYFSAVDTVSTLTLAANKGIYATGAGALSTYDLTAAGRAILDDADAAAQRTTLGLWQQQAVSADTTMTADVEDVYVTAACTLTLPTVASSKVGHATRIHLQGTSQLQVILSANAADKIEGAAMIALLAQSGEYILTPVSANKWTLGCIRGRSVRQHCLIDLTSASGASPWTISGTTWTDISSASSSVAASSGLQFTAANSTAYQGANTAACVRTPTSGLVDGWSRPLDTAKQRFWMIQKTSKTTSVGGSSPVVGTVLGKATFAAADLRWIIASDTGAATVNYVARVTASGSSSRTTTGTPFTSAGWLGFCYDGPRRTMVGYLCSTSPSGNPGASGGWWPDTYRGTDDYVWGQDILGTSLDPTVYTNIQIYQTNTTTGSKMTATAFAIMIEEGTPA